MSANPSNFESKVFIRELIESYENYKRSEIVSRRFLQGEMVRWLEPMIKDNIVRPSPLGKSAEGRPITLYSYGWGSVKVLLWSQMHGDEPTATMALLDMLNFFLKQRDHGITKAIRNNLTLLIVPMLNPDGAERFTRRTAQLVDMNRDAAALVTPEARILKTVQQNYLPDFGFNLHDQDPRYTVGTTKNVTAIALLAPATDISRGDTEVRLRAKRVASVLVNVLELCAPGHTAKYDDTYEPRAFGDSVQRWGTSTVLVESGGWPNDRDKMFIRKLNYVGLLSSLHSIAVGEYEQTDIDPYEKLPFNTKNLYDIIVRDVELKGLGKSPAIRVDLAFNLEQAEERSAKDRLMGKLVDLGDLSTFGALEERDGRQISLEATQIKLDQIVPWEAVEVFLK